MRNPQREVQGLGGDDEIQASGFGITIKSTITSRDFRDYRKIAICRINTNTFVLKKLKTNVLKLRLKLMWFSVILFLRLLQNSNYN